MDIDQESVSNCPVCGQSLAQGAPCDRCAQRNVRRLVRRETALLVVLAVCSVVLYLGTRALANSNRVMQVKFASLWYESGRRSLENGRAADAIAAFRKATVNDRANRAYLLSLAQALRAAGRDDEARDLLFQVRESAPENPEINLELARIAARQWNVPESLRYYHNALYGIWVGKEVDAQRQMIRRELIEFLISQNAKEQALSETVALAAHLPDTPAAHSELGAAFLRVDQPADALANYKLVLRHDPENSAALHGAGEAAYRLGNFAQSRRLLSSISKPDAKTQAMIETAKLVLENDPLEPHLSDDDRFRRLRRDMKQVEDSLEQCLARQATSTAAQYLSSLKDKLATQDKFITALSRHSDTNPLFSSLEMIYDTENAISGSCGPLDMQDMALRIVAQKSRGVEQ